MGRKTPEVKTSKQKVPKAVNILLSVDVLGEDSIESHKKVKLRQGGIYVDKSRSVSVQRKEGKICACA